MSADTPAADAAAPKKSKKKLIIGAVGGLVVVAAAAHFTILKPKPAAASTKPVAGKILTIPTQTLNLADGHLLQVGIAMQLTTVADQPKIVALEPKIDNITLQVLTPFTYHQLLGTKSRDLAEHELSRRVSALLNPKPTAAKATTAKPTKKGATSSGTAKSASKKAPSKKAVAAKASAVTAEPQVLSTYFATFLMQ